MARKKDPNRVNKDIMIRVRVTAEERKRFTVMAEKNGYRTISEYIRSLVADDRKDKKEKK